MRKAISTSGLILFVVAVALGIASSVRADDIDTDASEGEALLFENYDQAIQLAQAEPQALTRAEDSDDLRLELARVTLYAETRQYGKAFELIEDLKEKYPDNARVVAAEADLNLRVGNVRSASLRLNKAILIDPSDEDIVERERALKHAQSANVVGAVVFRETDVAEELIGRISGEFHVTDVVNVLLDFENNHLHSNQKLEERLIDTVDEQRGSLGSTVVFDNGDEAGLTLYANTDTVGVGLQYNLWDRTGGVTLLKGDFQRPDWSYVEMVVDRGTKSGVFLQHRRPLGQDFAVVAGGGYNWYALDSVPNAAQSSTWTFSLEYAPDFTLIDPNPDRDIHLGFAYSVDGEYLTSLKRVGLLARPAIPISDYEIHALTASARQAVMDDLTLEAYGGYGVNRLDQTNGPVLGGFIEYALIDELVLGLRASHTRFGGNNNRETENQLALNIKWIL